MRTKTIDVELKADDSTEGRFTGYASVFGNIDSYGDMVIAGAFAESLAEYASADYWRHRMDDPFMNLGTASAEEDERGLLVDCQIDLETAAGKQVHKLLKAKRVRQMSFAYDVLEGAWVDRKPEDGGSYYELRKLRLHEVSVVPIGANQDTEILAVKTAADVVLAGVKAGRGLSADEQHEARAAMAALGDALKQNDSTTPEPEDIPSKSDPAPSRSARALAEATIHRLHG
jgi:HK97 family phage prohead protease